MITRTTRAVLAFAVLTAFAATDAFAGVAGKVTGTVTDAETGRPLVAANVSLSGTVYGATTGDDGRFHILNVPAGLYELRVDYIGYKSHVIKQVRVSPDLTTRVNVALEPTLLEVGAETVVIAERELIQPSITNSYRVKTGEEIAEAPLRGYQEAVAVNAGVVEDEDGNFHFRGGRGNEVAFYVDGVLQNDLLSGTNNTEVSNGAIEEVSVQNGGFNAEYGYAMSGVVNVVTRSGGTEWSGQAEYLSDFLAGEWANTQSFGHNIVNASIGGPLTPGRQLRFFGSIEYQNLADKDPSPISVDEGQRLPHNSRKRYNATAKLTYKPSESFTLHGSFVRSQRDEDRYLEEWKKNIEHAPHVEDFTNNFSLKSTIFFGKAAFAEAQVSFFETDYQIGDGVFFDDLDAYLNGDTSKRDANLFWSENAVFDDYLHRNSRHIAARADLVRQFTDVFTPGFDHEVKIGVDLQRHTLRNYRNAIPVGGYTLVDAYGFDLQHNKYDGDDDFDQLLSGPKKPLLFAAYFQDKIEFEDLIINAGVRFDYLDSNTKALKGLSNVAQPDKVLQVVGDDQIFNEDDFTDNKASTQVSPRIGVSFPVSERTHFHLNYGRFFQQPNLNDLYSGLYWYDQLAVSQGVAAQLGNPNLQAQRTTAYEVGVKHELSDGIAMDVTAFYRDTRGLINLFNQPANPRAVIMPFNQDFGTNKGIELDVEMRRRNKIAGQLSYTLSKATGTGSSDNSAFNNAWLDYNNAKTTKTLDYDQRHSLLVAVDVRNKEGEGPKFMGGMPLQNAGVNFILRAGSGLAYTPTEIYNVPDLGAVPRYAGLLTGPINSERRPWNIRLDMKANKEFTTPMGSANVYLEVLNLLNRRNAVEVYTATGSPEDDGYLGSPSAEQQLSTVGSEGVTEEEFIAAYLDRLSDPANYDIPRLVRLGLVLSF